MSALSATEMILTPDGIVSHAVSHIDGTGVEIHPAAGTSESVAKVLEATAPNADKVTQLDFGNFEKFSAAPVPGELVDKLTAVDVETLTPLEALNFLYELKQTLVK